MVTLCVLRYVLFFPPGNLEGRDCGVDVGDGETTFISDSWDDELNSSCEGETTFISDSGDIELDSSGVIPLFSTTGIGEIDESKWGEGVSMDDVVPVGDGVTRLGSLGDGVNGGDDWFELIVNCSI